MIKETLEQNQNSIELALSSFLVNYFKLSGKLDEKEKQKLGAIISKEIAFSDYLELGYALDEFDDTQEHKTTKNRAAVFKILKILSKYKEIISANLDQLGKSSGQDMANKINQLPKESVNVKYNLSSELHEDKKYNYTAKINSKIIETVLKYLSEKNITHYFDEQNDLVVECETRDDLYSFDKYLAKMAESYKKMFDDTQMAEAKKRPQDMTNLDLARLNKPRMDITKMPKAGAFDKDTKGQIRKKDPGDRRAMKHKNTSYESVTESFLGVTSVPSIMRLQALAGLETVPNEQMPTVPDTVSQPARTEAYLTALDHISIIKSLVPDFTVSEWRELEQILINILDEYKL